MERRQCIIEANRRRKRFGWRTVWRWSPPERLLRVARIAWRRGLGSGVGGNGNHESEVSFAVGVPRFCFRRECDGLLVWIGPFRVHYQREYGGWIDYLGDDGDAN